MGPTNHGPIVWDYPRLKALLSELKPEIFLKGLEISFSNFVIANSSTKDLREFHTALCDEDQIPVICETFQKYRDGSPEFVEIFRMWDALVEVCRSNFSS